MKFNLGRKIVLILAVLLIIPVFLHQNTSVAFAAAPNFTKRNITISGSGETYQLRIKNTVKGSKYKWSTSNMNTAIVTNKGMVTSINSGTAVISCKITYPSKKTRIITCSIWIRIPADSIKITNASETKGAQRLFVGDSYKFTCKMTPANTNDNVYWSIGEDGDRDCISVDQNGTVTGLKVGKAVVVATAASKANSNSIINDAEIIEVVNESATVVSAELLNTNQIKVVFDCPIDRSTVIGPDGKLLDSITITRKANVKNIKANDPGTLSAELSSDLKTLTINAENAFIGEYGIEFTSKIKSVSGLAIDEYSKNLSYTDTTAPELSSVVLDGSGMITNINFTEPIDVTNLKVSDAQLANTNGIITYDLTTIALIKNRANYILSSDKKTLYINMANISQSDYGKTFSVNLSGIKDLSGNATKNTKIMVYLSTDTTPKPQAQPLSITRTSYNTLTATFDRAVKIPGSITVNGSSIYGSVDTNDSKKVNYTLSYTQEVLTGNQTVYIGYWNGYNVMSSDNTSSQMRSFTVNFSVDVTFPTLSTYEFDPDTSVLTLNYNKKVTLENPNGTFSAIVSAIAGNTAANTITYAQISSTDDKVIKLQLSNMTQTGTYTFNLTSGFALDEYHNSSQLRDITIDNSNGTASELPGPYSIYQSTTNSNQIYLEFPKQLDVDSAQNIENYSIAGVSIVSAVVTKNTPDSGATVLLTISANSVNATAQRPISITGVKGYGGSYSEISTFTSTVLLTDNAKPYLVSTVFDKSKKNTICLNFSEQIQGTMSFSIYQLGTSNSFANTVSVSGNSVYITLGTIPTNGTYLNINILSCNITDMSGNTATIVNPSLGVAVSY